MLKEGNMLFTYKLISGITFISSLAMFLVNLFFVFVLNINFIPYGLVTGILTMVSMVAYTVFSLIELKTEKERI